MSKSVMQKRWALLISYTNAKMDPSNENLCDFLSNVFLEDWSCLPEAFDEMLKIDFKEYKRIAENSEIAFLVFELICMNYFYGCYEKPSKQEKFILERLRIIQKLSKSLSKPNKVLRHKKLSSHGKMGYLGILVEARFLNLGPKFSDDIKNSKISESSINKYVKKGKSFFEKNPDLNLLSPFKKASLSENGKGRLRLNLTSKDGSVVSVSISPNLSLFLNLFWKYKEIIHLNDGTKLYRAPILKMFNSVERKEALPIQSKDLGQFAQYISKEVCRLHQRIKVGTHNRYGLSGFHIIIKTPSHYKILIPDIDLSKLR